VDFLDWKEEKNLHKASVVAKFGLSDRDEYEKYYAVAGKIQKLTRHLGRMPPDDPFRKLMTQALLKKLYDMGLTQQTQSLLDADKVTVSSFCRRRLAIVLRNLKMCEHLPQAMDYVRQGHVRIGPRVALDPAVLVTRKMEDFVTWVDDSKIRQKVLKFNDEFDDYDAKN
jgi:U3 small nucleolar ribonucleoprotein protein IMP3